MKKNILLFTFFLSLNVYAQEHFIFSPISSINGLSDDRVRTICQLPDGRMVIVTEGLVNIYDGSTFSYMHYNELEAYVVKKNFMAHRAYIDNENHLWLKNQSKLMLFDIRTELFVPNVDSVFATQGILSRVENFFIDSELNIWYETQNDELILRNGKNKKTTTFLTQVSKLGGSNEQLVDVSKQGDLVFLIYKSGQIICFDFDSRKENYREHIFPIRPGVISLLVAPFEQYLYLTQSYEDYGLVLRYNINSRVSETVLETNHGLATLTVDQEGNSWVSTVKGLWKIDKNLENKHLISQIELSYGKVHQAHLCTQYNDDKGGLWVGSVNRGVFYYHPDRFKFRTFGSSLFNHPSTVDLSVNGFAEEDDYILIGTHNGLYKYFKNSKTIEPFSLVPENTPCFMLLKDSKQRIWVCSNKRVYSIVNNNIRNYNLPFIVFYLYEATDGELFLCTDKGIWAFDPQTGAYKNPKQQLRQTISWTYQLVDYDETSLLGYSTEGLFIYNKQCNQLSFPDKNSPLLQYNSHYYHCLFTDSRGLTWIGTMDGLNVYDHTTNTTTSFSDEEGLVNNSIRSIIEDNAGNIWVSTSGGISFIEVSDNDDSFKFKFRNYNYFDGVIKSEFMPRSVFKTSDNRILWGGLDGFNEIELNRFDSSKQELSIPLFTNILVSGTKIKLGETYNGNTILKQSITSTKEVTLKYFQNSIGFEFSALNYVNPTQTYYRYKLEGADENWQEIKASDGMGRVNYINLPSKTYRLKIHAANNNGEWTDQYAEMIINIRPPFWLTWWAKAIYYILFITSFYLGLSFYLRRNKKKMEKRQKEELEEMKLSFFTNISHELRTPLTLILTPLYSLLKKTGDEALKTQLSGIYRNASELLNMVNQLLDFRKIEGNGESLQLKYCSVNDFFEQVASPFFELSKEKDIHFTTEYLNENIYSYIDKEKLQKIINNLLSNAFKFTPKGGHIDFKIQHDSNACSIVMQVVDNGCGIPEADLSQIFDRFYQANNHQALQTGSGIGLHLVKKYVHLHKGTVEVESQINKGCTFSVKIPSDLQPNEAYHPKLKDGDHTLKLLIVEDNLEFRNFLYHELSEQYHVLLATNGKEGLEITLQEHPDLVISDVMMPEMTGVELCQTLKQDVQISHIPVILLTAKASEQAQIEGFEVGADAYVTKPFNMDILLLRINNLIEKKQKRIDDFKNNIVINTESFALTDVDQKFIAKVITTFEKNISNPSYSVDQLSKDMLMERTGLYRKLVALIGQTPREFIRLVRMKRAAQLLESGLSVVEVWERVGIVHASSGYFAKCFQDEFGITPSQYKEMKKQETPSE